MKQLFSSLVIYCRQKPLDIFILLVFVIAIVALMRLHFRTQVDDDWGQFKAEHNCEPIRAIGGNNIKSGWVCDDGNEYYRWRQQL